MKITWFGGTTFRVQAGGEIVVTDAALASAHIDAGELVSGADHLQEFAKLDALPLFEPVSATRSRRTVLDDADEAGCTLSGYGDSVLALTAQDEPMLFVAGTVTQTWDRTADGAVVVLTGTADEMGDAVASLYVGARPRLIALAIDDPDALAFTDLATRAPGCAIQVLDKGLALEV